MPRPTEQPQEWVAKVRGARERLGEVRSWTKRVNPALASGASPSPVRNVLVFDVDVIKLYSHPSSSFEYCALLRSESESRNECELIREHGQTPSPLAQAETDLADIIGNYLIWLRDEQMWVSPMHHVELDSVSLSVYRSALPQALPVMRHLQETFRAVDLQSGVATSSGASHQEETIERKVERQMQQVFNDAPQVAEALRLDLAMQNDRIRSLDFFTLRNNAYLTSWSEIKADEGWRHVAQTLLDTLTADKKFNEKRIKKFRVDAECLAYLHWLNLQELRNDAGQLLRFSLVTGAPHLHGLSERLRASNRFASDEVIFHELAKALDEMLQHPIGFLGDVQFSRLLETEAADNLGSLRLMLRGFLARYVAELENQHKSNDSGASVLKKEDTQELAKKRFMAATTSVADFLAKAKARQLFRPEQTWFQKIVQQLKSDPASLEQAVVATMQEQLAKFSVNLLTLQLPLGLVGVPRNLPPIVFVEAKEAEKLFAHLRRNTSEYLRKDASTLSNMLLKVYEEDKTLYTTFLAFSLIHANAGDWSNARRFAESAVDVADSLKDMRERKVRSHSNATDQAMVTQYIYGEEAYYLAAVAWRLSPLIRKQNEQDVIEVGWDRTLGYLKKAHTVYEQQCKEMKGYSETTTPSRIASEELSVKTAMLWYDLLSQGRLANDELAEKSRKLFRAVLQTSAIVVKEVSSNSMLSRGYAIQYVLQQLSVSAAQLILFDRYRLFAGILYKIQEKTWSENERFCRSIEGMWMAFDDQCRTLETAAAKEPSVDLPRVSAWVLAVWSAVGLELERFSLAEKKEQANRAIVAIDKMLQVRSSENSRLRYLRQIIERRAKD